MPIDIVVDRGSPVPLYFQLAQQLEQAVQDGELKPGDQLEAEVDLAERTGLSRPTVRQAIQELVKKGILVRRRGVGTQVVHSQLKRPVALSSLYDVLLREHRRPTTQVLEFRTQSADAEVAEALTREVGAEVYYFRRLRLSQGEPLAVMANWIPADIADLSPEALASHGLYELLRRAGIHFRIANQRIGARAATRAEAKLLATAAGAPLLTMRRVTFDHDGRAVELGTHIYRADSYVFETTLVEG